MTPIDRELISERDHMRLDHLGEFDEPFRIYEWVPGQWVCERGTRDEAALKAEYERQQAAFNDHPSREEVDRDDLAAELLLVAHRRRVRAARPYCMCREGLLREAERFEKQAQELRSKR